MSVSAHFSVTTAAALVLGGIAAIVLATVIALSGSNRPSGGRAPLDSSQAAPPHPTASMAGAPPEIEVE